MKNHFNINILLCKKYSKNGLSNVFDELVISEDKIADFDIVVLNNRIEPIKDNKYTLKLFITYLGEKRRHKYLYSFLLPPLIAPTTSTPVKMKNNVEIGMHILELNKFEFFEKGSYEISAYLFDGHETETGEALIKKSNSDYEKVDNIICCIPLLVK